MRALRKRLPSARPERTALALLGLLVVAGVVLRGLLTYAWRPAMLGYPDSGTYLTATSHQALADPMRTMGYALFMRIVHFVRPELTLVVLLQHAMGVASALLLYGAVRRVTGSVWAGLLPAAVVLLWGMGIFVEHAVLTESLFVFLQSLAVYAIVRSTGSRALAWAALAGLAAGATPTVRVIGIYLIPVITLAAAFLATERHWRARLLPAGIALLAALVVPLSYAIAQDNFSGHFGLTRGGQWNLYGRVGPFADCSKFSPPAGTRVLCETTPKRDRPGPIFYVFNGSTPAVAKLGGPFGNDQSVNDRVARFAHAAIIHQPFDYLSAVGRDLTRYIDPEKNGGAGYGLQPDGLVRDSLLQTPGMELRPYWNTSGYTIHGGLVDDFLAPYERHTRVQGALFVVLALLGLVAPFAAPRGLPRRGAVFFTLLAAVALVLPVAGFEYDARFGVPGTGLLGAAAGIGLWGLLVRLRQRYPSRASSAAVSASTTRRTSSSDSAGNIGSEISPQ